MRIINPARLVGSHPRPPLIPMQAGFSSIKSLSLATLAFVAGKKSLFFARKNILIPLEAALLIREGKESFFLKKEIFSLPPSNYISITGHFFGFSALQSPASPCKTYLALDVSLIARAIVLENALFSISCQAIHGSKIIL